MGSVQLLGLWPSAPYNLYYDNICAYSIPAPSLPAVYPYLEAKQL